MSGVDGLLVLDVVLVLFELSELLDASSLPVDV
jgi:hypothetical protein